MKKIIAFLLVTIMILGTVACGKTGGSKQIKNPETVGEFLLVDFKENAREKDETLQDIVEEICDNDILPFEPVIMPMEPGVMMGFDNAEITGFKQCLTFAPMVSTLPFLGYVFELEDDADVEAFKTTLEENANLRWNICTEAEELVVESEGNMVFFLMCPKSFEETAE